MRNPIRILYYDDHPLDRGVVRTALEREGDRFQVVEVSSRSGLVESLAQNNYDLLLADDVTQDLDRLEALGLAWTRHPGLPVVYLSSEGHLESAVEAMKRGAADYLVKSKEVLHKLPQTLLEVLDRPRREKEQQRDALHRQLQELTVLHSVSAAASAALSEEGLVQTITRIISETFQINHLSIGFIDESAGQLRPYRSQVLPGKNGDYALALGDGITGWVALHGLPRNVPDVRLEPDYRMSNPDTHSELCVPIKAGNRVLGVINVESDQVNAFTDADERLLTTLSGQLTTAIERIRLFEQTQRQAREISGLYDIALTTSSVLDVDSLLERIYLQMQQLIKPDTFMIVLSGEQPSSYYVALAMEEGQAIREWVGLPISMDEGLMGWILRTRQTLLIRDMEKDYLPAQPKHSSRPARSWLGAPLISRDRLIGVISVQSFQSQAFDHTHRRFLESLAGQVSIVLENARLFQETRRRLSELEAVNKIAAAIRSAETLDVMLSCLLDETLSAVDAQAGAFWLFDANRDELTRIVARGWLSQLPGEVIRRGDGLLWKTLSSQEAILSSEFAGDSQFNEYPSELIPTGWSGVCLPIQAAREMVGVFLISVPTPRQVTTEELHLLTTLSEMAGNAIHRMRLHGQTERRLQHLAALHVIDMAISASVDMRITLNILLEQITTQLLVDAADIMLYNPFLQTLEYYLGRGFRSKPVESIKLRLGEGYAGRAAMEHRIITVTKMTRAGQTAPLPGMWAGENFVIYMAVPLIAKGQVKGVLNIYHRSPLSPDADWMNVLETMSTQAAIAIDNSTLFDNLQRANVELALAYDATIEGWSRALDLRDRETEGHTRRVAEMTLQLARGMGVKDNELVHIRRGALLHDIGKMGISDAILTKTGSLSGDEWDIMKRHPQYAYDLLSPIFYLYPALDIPYCHHEKWDGSGYPRGLIGERIPLAARIFAVADVWDALINDRCYRKAWSKEEARKYIITQAGKHFDPKVVEVFLRFLGNGEGAEGEH